MHARQTGWQRLAIIVTTLSCLLLSVVVAAADSAPEPRRDAQVSPVPHVRDAVIRYGTGTVGGGHAGGPGSIAAVRSTLNDVTAIPVPVAATGVTVAYTVERGPDGDAEIVTTRVPAAAAAEALVDELAERPRVAAAEVDTVFAALQDTPAGPRAVSDPERRLGLAGIADGCAVRRFCPAQAVTRGQMATFLSRVPDGVVPGARACRRRLAGEAPS